MRVLEIGARHRPQAYELWPDAEVLTMDMDEDNNPDIVANAADIPHDLFHTFDAVFASHVLEHFTWKAGPGVLAQWTNLLVDGGEIHIKVPALEWAAYEILSEDPSPALLIHLYGGHMNVYDAHMTGFTMRTLRVWFEQLNLHVFRARSFPYTIAINDQVFKCQEHYIAGKLRGRVPLAKE